MQAVGKHMVDCRPEMAIEDNFNDIHLRELNDTFSTLGFCMIFYSNVMSSCGIRFLYTLDTVIAGIPGNWANNASLTGLTAEGN